MTSDSINLSPWLAQRLPWWLWLLALLAGCLLALGSLSYAPAGRINLLWLWWLWAGLPLLGSLVALAMLFLGRGRPWLFRWRQRSLHWYPDRRERLVLFARVQLWWLLLGLGLLATYLLLLLFTDLAFGWSSTLIQDPARVEAFIRAIASPWASFWPAAAPDTPLIEASRYLRIAPTTGDPSLAGDWWPFLLASLLTYNLLPRLLLAGLSLVLLRWHQHSALQLRAPDTGPGLGPVADSQRDLLSHWQSVPRLAWELAPAQARDAQLHLGLGDWAAEEQALRQSLVAAPERLVWRVNASRSPVAELADLQRLAQQLGVRQQALELVVNAQTDPQRHVASWRAFANRQQLVWLEEAL